jgi:hypothetical protein
METVRRRGFLAIATGLFFPACKVLGQQTLPAARRSSDDVQQLHDPNRDRSYLAELKKLVNNEDAEAVLKKVLDPNKAAQDLLDMIEPLVPLEEYEKFRKRAVTKDGTARYEAVKEKLKKLLDELPGKVQRTKSLEEGLKSLEEALSKEKKP